MAVRNLVPAVSSDTPSGTWSAPIDSCATFSSGEAVSAGTNQNHLLLTVFVADAPSAVWLHALPSAGTLPLSDPRWGRQFSSSSYIKSFTISGLEEAAAPLQAADPLKAENLEKLAHMSGFQEDWNGTGGFAFSPSAIALFRQLINVLDRQPQIAPTGRGSLLLQYERGDHSLLAFELSEHRADMVFVPEGNYSEAMSWTFTEDIVNQINLEVTHFYESGCN